MSVQTRRATQARDDSPSHASTRKLGNGVISLDTGRENVHAWGKDIDLVAKVGERGEGVIDGGGTDGDGLRDTSRGDGVCVFGVALCVAVSGRDDEGDALVDGVRHLWRGELANERW